MLLLLVIYFFNFTFFGQLHLIDLIASNFVIRVILEIFHIHLKNYSKKTSNFYQDYLINSLFQYSFK